MVSLDQRLGNTTGRGITPHAGIIWSSTIPVLVGRSNQAALRNMPSHLSETDPTNREEPFVHDLVSGGLKIYAAQKIKEGSIDVFGQLLFKLHKWKSNVPELESASELSNGDTTFAKE